MPPVPDPAAATTAALGRALELLEGAAVLDRPVTVLQKASGVLFGPQWLRDLLHGVPIGHPLHPALTDVPIGAWTSAVLLDAVPGTGPAAATLIAAGLAASLPAAAAGLVDASQLHPQQLRVAVVHAGANTAALGLFAGSLLQRLRGRRLAGKSLSLLGLLAVSGGGFLGGHLSYRQAVGANHAEFVPHRFPPGWQRAGRLAELPERTLVRRQIGGVDLVFYRTGDRVRVLADTCSHLAAPLSAGEVVQVGAQDCVRCPWHGSTFRLSDGGVVHGPATAPLPSLDVRLVDDGVLEVLLPGAG